MRGVRRVADQQHVAVPPGAGAHGREPDPAAVVGDQVTALERVGEDLRAEGDGRLVALARLPGAIARVELAALQPALLLELHDEGAHGVAVRVGVRLHDAAVRLGDEELERLEDERRAEPDVARPARVDARPEHVLPRLPGEAVGPVGRDHEVVRLAELVERRRELPVVDVHPEFLAPLAQDGQQALAADRGKAVPAGRDHVAAVVDVDVVPDREIPRELLVERGVRLLDSPQSFVREHDPEAECVVGRVALPDLDPVVWVEELHERRQIQARRPRPDDRDLKRRPRGSQLLSRSRNRWSLPVAVRGSASATWMAGGYL